jgi:hypothetical protein
MAVEMIGGPRLCEPPLATGLGRFTGAASRHANGPRTACIVRTASFGVNSEYLNGAPGEIRTPNPQIRSLVLYPVELRALLVGVDI